MGKKNNMQTIVITIVVAGLLASSAFSQEHKNYVVASGNLVEKTKVKQLTGVLRQKNLWLTGADRQTHPVCVIQLSGSTRGVFVMDYRPTDPVGSIVRMAVVPTNPVARPGTDVRPATGLDSSIDVHRAAKCYALVRAATPIDYQIAQRKKEREAE